MGITLLLEGGDIVRDIMWAAAKSFLDKKRGWGRWSDRQPGSCLDVKLRYEWPYGRNLAFIGRFDAGYWYPLCKQSTDTAICCGHRNCARSCPWWRRSDGCWSLPSLPCNDTWTADCTVHCGLWILIISWHRAAWFSDATIGKLGRKVYTRIRESSNFICWWLHLVGYRNLAPRIRLGLNRKNVRLVTLVPRWIARRDGWSWKGI